VMGRRMGDCIMDEMWINEIVAAKMAVYEGILQLEEPNGRMQCY